MLNLAQANLPVLKVRDPLTRGVHDLEVLFGEHRQVEAFEDRVTPKGLKAQVRADDEDSPLAIVEALVCARLWCGASFTLLVFGVRVFWRVFTLEVAGEAPC